ncbi:ankyrin-1-like [Phymastichus coffea]|uniref:ankyrin-1-like n=1 Tax=Phymastichus coffea TaxID=108790 RepID=UPI00273BE277|nr:ankyrin-1-like [Phymastichus coffea]
MSFENEAETSAKDECGRIPIDLNMFSNKSRAKEFLDRTLDIFPSREKRKVFKKDVSSESFLHLFVAAYADDDEAIVRLLQSGAQVDVSWPIDSGSNLSSKLQGLTPLHLAIDSDSEKAVRALIEGGANIFIENPNREHDSPLQRMFRKRMFPEYFVDKMRLSGTSLTALDSSGLTQLHMACSICHLEWAKELLEMGANVNAVMLQSTNKDDKTYSEATPLIVVFQSVARRDTPANLMGLLQLLIQQGADVTIAHNGITPLHLAYRRFRSEYHQLLDSNSQRFRRFNDDYWYSSNLSNDLIEDARYGTDFHVGSTALLFCKIADLLLTSQSSYNFNAADPDGFSHFHYACLRNNVDIVYQFLDNGVDVNQKTSIFIINDAGFSPLHFAFIYRAEEVINILLENGANANDGDAYGNTPLHIAIIHNFLNFMLFDKLIRKGANINAKNIARETPMDCFVKNKNVTIERLKYFIDKGAIIDASDGELITKIFDTVLKNVIFKDVMPACQILLQTYYAEDDIRTKFNIIHSLVAVKREDYSLDFYLIAISDFLEVGYELDWQDAYGQTALHRACSECVDAAVEALLMLGADINVIDKKGQPVFTLKMACTSKKDCQNVVAILLRHAWKMKQIPLNVLNPIIQLKQYRRLSRSFVRDCNHELIIIKYSTIGHVVPVRNMLSDYGAEYLAMPVAHRKLIDNYLIDIHYLRNEFPIFCGILMMQYRRARDRARLIKLAKHVITSECKISLPDFCLETIFKYFKYNDLKILTDPDNSNRLDKLLTSSDDSENVRSNDVYRRLTSMLTGNNEDFDNDYNEDEVEDLSNYDDEDDWNSEYIRDKDGWISDSDDDDDDEHIINVDK